MTQKIELSLGASLEYQDLLAFAHSHKRITFSEFDQFLLHDIDLFVIPKDEHFHALELSLDKIIRALPALKRIFTKPITRLKDVLNILPVESVRVINNQSMSHVSRHSELWGDISKHQLKPKKLMTLDREENYALYENIAFTRLINIILSFVKKSILLLKDIIYAHRDLKFNLLERTNHLSYFLAIGKLHMGYARAQEKNTHAYQRCLNKLLFIDNALSSKLHCRVYKACNKYKNKISLKKSNIFRNQKDYKTVYNLLKWFNRGTEEISEEIYFLDVSNLAFSVYCNMLTIFALSHFNFSFDKKQRFNFMSINADCSFMDWKIHVQSISDSGIDGLRFLIEKDVRKEFCFIFCPKEIDHKSISAFKNLNQASEYFICSLYEQNGDNVVYLNMFDIDSFRRVQQIILRQMIYADTKKEICPFCGHHLKNKDGDFVCDSCRMIIKNLTCPNTNLTYYVTDIVGFDIIKSNPTSYTENKFLFAKTHESQMYYRNITKLNQANQAICPHCGKTHESSHENYNLKPNN